MIDVLERPSVRADSGHFDGVKQMAPAALGVLPFAVMIGVAIGESPVNEFVGFIGGLITAGGSAHLAATGSMSVGAGLLATVFTALMINARGLVYGAALAPSIRHHPRWFRWIAAYALVDQMYVLVSSVLDRSDRYVRSFHLAAMSLLWTAYMGGIAIGLALGPVIPASIPLGLGVPVLFLTMLIPGLQGRASYAATLVGLVGSVAASGMPSGTGLIAAILAGTMAGVLADRNEDA